MYMNMDMFVLVHAEFKKKCSTIEIIMGIIFNLKETTLFD
jgi:hypothetical protein